MVFHSEYLDRILHDVDFNQRAGRNQLAHGVVLEANYGIAVASGIKAFAQGGGRVASSWGFNFSRLVS